jgi:hypothetical protein
MLKHTHIILATSTALIAASQALAVCTDFSAVSIQNIGYAGNGCPAGSATVILADDRQSVSVLFDEYIVEAGGINQRAFDRKKCDIAFGLKIPEGISVSLVDAEYQGKIDLPAGAKATFTRDYFFAGSKGPERKSTWEGSLNQDFNLKDSVDLWSACGADVILRSKNAGIVRTQAGEPASLAINTSIKLQQIPVLRYNLAYRRC